MKTTPRFEEQYKGYTLRGEYFGLHSLARKYDYRISVWEAEDFIIAGGVSQDILIATPGCEEPTDCQVVDSLNRPDC